MHLIYNQPCMLLLIKGAAQARAQLHAFAADGQDTRR
jgi:hypothetical protein